MNLLQYSIDSSKSRNSKVINVPRACRTSDTPSTPKGYDNSVLPLCNRLDYIFIIIIPGTW